MGANKSQKFKKYFYSLKKPKYQFEEDEEEKSANFLTEARKRREVQRLLKRELEKSDMKNNKTLYKTLPQP